MIHRLCKERTLRGEITVFLALLSSLFLGLICALAQSARLQMIKMNIEGVMDAGLKSCFGEYDKDLYIRYDLIYIDSSYKGRSEAGIESVITHLTEYMTENTDYSDTTATADWYIERVDDAQAEEFVIASDEGGRPLKLQAVEYMEKYAEIKHVGTSGLAKSSPVRGKKDNDFFEEWDSILDKIDAYGLPLTNPGKIVRGMVLSEDEFLKGSPPFGNMYGDCPSLRGLKEGGGSAYLNRKNENDDLFIEYIMLKCGCYTEYYKDQLLTGELEYIVYGEASDRDNLIKTVGELTDIRLEDNLRCIKADGGKVSAAYEKAYEVVMFNSLTVPPPGLIMLVRDSIIYAWAYGESAIDVSRLLNKGRCKLRKGSSDIELSLEEITDFLSRLFESGGSGSTYKEILGMFVASTADEKRRLRLMDIIEGNMRAFGSGSFRIDGCVEYLKAQVSLSSGHGSHHTIEREYMYE